NWTPITVPNGPDDVATFAVSNTTDITVGISTEVNSIVFNPGASAYTITPPFTGDLTVSGVGIVNNSGITQQLGDFGESGSGHHLIFTGSATAGTKTSFRMLSLSNVLFMDSTTAATSTFTLDSGGAVYFYDNSTAADATFIVNSSSSGSTVGFSGT